MQKPLRLALFACALLVSASAVTLAAPQKPPALVSPLLSAKTIQVTLKIINTGTNAQGGPDTTLGTQYCYFQSPGKARVEGTFQPRSGGEQATTLISDGKTLTFYRPLVQEYNQLPQPTRDIPILAHIESYLPVTPVPNMLNGHKCLRFTQAHQESTGALFTTQLWIDAVTHLPMREEKTEKQDGPNSCHPPGGLF